MKSRWLLRALRANQQPKLSQRQLAQRVATRLNRSFSEPRYWQIENGYGNPASQDERAAIAAELNVKPSAIDWPALEGARAS